MSNMAVNTNMLAINSHRALKTAGAGQAKASAKLSSGQRINSAADDAAGLAISEKMRSQMRGLDMASKNAQDGISMVQTAEGGMTEIGNMVQRVRELTVQSANDSNGEDDRVKIQQEVNQLLEEVNSMADRVEFNGKKLIDGSLSGAGNGIHLQVGANGGQSISFAVGSLKTTALKIDGHDVTGTNGGAIGDKLSIIDNALKKITDERSKLGAVQNRLEYSIKSLDISNENITAAESRIRDTDMAKEMMNLTKSNVLQQAATTMLSQANQAPQNVLQLLR
jgi:flagellin